MPMISMKIEWDKQAVIEWDHVHNVKAIVIIGNDNKNQKTEVLKFFNPELDYPNTRRKLRAWHSASAHNIDNASRNADWTTYTDGNTYTDGTTLC